jgi:hypothetical protein
MLDAMVATRHMMEQDEEIARLRQDLAAARALNDAMIATLPGTYYMDEPDGGNVMPEEQMRRMAEDAKRYRQAEADLKSGAGADRCAATFLRRLLVLLSAQWRVF